MNCDCKYWEPNIDKINSFIMLGFSHSIKFDGVPFIYCPWCGKKLVEKEKKKNGKTV